MEVAEEDRAQIAKRQAIQTIMRDTSLTPQEKQKKIQEFMTTGGNAGPAPPAPAAPPVSSLGNGSAGVASPQPATSKQAMMKEVMRDTSLTAQEKQKKIQDIMAGAPPQSATTPAVEPRAQEPELTSAPAAAPARPSSSRQSLMQEVMTDSTLSPQEKQQRIQQILKGGGTASTSSSLPPPVAAPEPDPPPLPPPAASSSSGSTSRQAIQEIMRDSSLTPQEKQQMIQQIMKTGSPAPVTPAAAPAVAAASPTAISTSRAGGDTEIKARARGTTTAATVPGAMESEPNPPPSAGAISSTGLDPASRKGSRSSVALPGAAARSRTDPAARKTQRQSVRMAQSAAVTAARSAFPGASTAVATSPRSDLSAVKSTEMDGEGDTAPAHPAAQGETGEIREIRDLEANVLDKTWQMPPVGTIQSPPQARHEEQRAVASDSVGPGDVVSAGVAQVAEAAPSEALNSPISAAYAGLSYAPDIAGADTGGIEAYVADPADNAVEAAKVVTEEHLEEIDRKKTTRFIQSGFFLCVVLSAIVFPIVFLVPGDPAPPVNITDAPSQAPSSSPTGATFAELMAELQILYDDDVMYKEVFSDETSPQYKAAVWTSYEDPHGLSGSDPRMVSRYALATFYFATNGDEWTRCGQDSTNCDGVREWLTAPNECDWLAVECVDPGNGNYTVEEIHFRPTSVMGNNIKGTLPFDVALLPSLKILILSRQALKGSVPESWARMSNLESIIVSSNELNGTFPAFLVEENPLLGTIYFGGNKLSGQLPASLMSTSLADLRLNNNGISGAIPASFLGMSALRTLHLDNNELTGTIPAELYKLPNIRTIRLSNNTGINGTISDGIANLKALQQLRLVNTGLDGTLPSGLFDLIDLTVLDLEHCSFSGSLPESFAKLANITQVRLNNNTFTGSIPLAFESLTYLRVLELYGNELTGIVSAELCNRTGDSFLDIQVLTADCLGDPPEVSCDCCDNCPMDG